MASLFMQSISLLSAGLRSGATFVGALGAAGLLAQFTHAPPIFLALIASLVAAGMAFALAAQDPFDADYTSLSQTGAHVVSFFAVLLGLWGIVKIAPTTSSFVCEPLVPWQFSIAIFGAFGMSWLSEATRLRIRHDRAGLMLHLAFFWIAPFYGFFHAPWFLAQTIAMPCAGRPLAQGIVIVLGMVAAAIAGRQTATWMMR
jgi:hypothetical protein